MDHAREALRAECASSLTRHPQRWRVVQFNIGDTVPHRRESARNIRAYTAYVGVKRGVNIKQIVIKVVRTCRENSCGMKVISDRQPSTEHCWKLNLTTPHERSCFCADDCAEDPKKWGERCTPAYTASQMARTIRQHVSETLCLALETICGLVKAKGLYSGQPTFSHYCATEREKHTAT